MVVINSNDREINVPPTREQVGKLFNGQSPTEFQKLRLCILCEGEAIVFTDDLSLKEYAISTMCQKCQNGVFKVKEWNEL